MLVLKCACCGFTQSFPSPDEAYLEGWDAPPHFSYQCCPLCPAACLVLPSVRHEKAHAHWREHGRPASFDRFCAPDENWGATQEQWDQQMKKAEEFSGQLAAKIFGKGDA